MAILWCGGEDLDFEVRPAGFGHYPTQYRSNYSRTSVTHDATNVDAELATYPCDTPVTTLWATARSYFGNFSVARRFLGIGRKGYVGGLFLKTDATGSYKLTLCKRNESGVDTELVVESGTSLLAAAMKFDILIENFGVSGRVRVYLNQNTNFGAAPLIDTGAGGIDLTWPDGPTALDRFVLVGPRASGTSGVGWGEFILADEDTRSMSLVTLAPNGAGAANTFTAGTYLDVNESAMASDRTCMSSDVSAQHTELALSDLPSGTFTIKAVKVVAKAVRGATGIQRLKLGIRDNVSGINVDAGHLLSASWGEYSRLMLTNPAAGRAWAQGDINGLQVALESLT